MRTEGRVNKISNCGSEGAVFRVTGRLKDRRDRGLGEEDMAEAEADAIDINALPQRKTMDVSMRLSQVV